MALLDANIQLVVAPIVIISATGLMALMLQSRYGRIIDRIRSFEAEKSRPVVPGQEDEALHAHRNKNIDAQVDMLLRRGRYIRNSLFSIFLSSLLIIVFSITAFASSMFNLQTGTDIAYIILGMSLVAIFVGVVFATSEIMISYRAILLEIEFWGSHTKAPESDNKAK